MEGYTTTLEILLGGTTKVYVGSVNLIRSDAGFFVYNAHGDVVRVVDAAGVVVKSYDYDAFGVEREPDADDGNPWRYCGEYWDVETGTVYLRARYYVPVLGRFITQDDWEFADLKDPLSLNLYTYCANSPVMYVDPEGRSPELVQDAMNLARELVYIDGPYPFGDLLAAGILVFVGGVLVWDNRQAIADGMERIGRSIGGLFMKRSARIDWGNIPENTVNHLLKGTDGKHIEGWKKFGIDPNDPKSFVPLIPFLKEAIDKGIEMIQNVGGGRIIEYVHYIKDKSFEIVVKVFEHPNGIRVLTDAYEKTK